VQRKVDSTSNNIFLDFFADAQDLIFTSNPLILLRLCPRMRSVAIDGALLKNSLALCDAETDRRLNVQNLQKPLLLKPLLYIGERKLLALQGRRGYKGGLRAQEEGALGGGDLGGGGRPERRRVRGRGRSRGC
jgi:hypothetical protein